MSKPLLAFIQAIFPRIQTQHEIDEGFLAKSIDLSDLERRMRALEHEGKRYAGGLVFNT